MRHYKWVLICIVCCFQYCHYTWILICIVCHLQYYLLIHFATFFLFLSLLPSSKFSSNLISYCPSCSFLTDFQNCGLNYKSTCVLQLNSFYCFSFEINTSLHWSTYTHIKTLKCRKTFMHKNQNILTQYDSL